MIDGNGRDPAEPIDEQEIIGALEMLYCNDGDEAFRERFPAIKELADEKYKGDLWTALHHADETDDWWQDRSKYMALLKGRGE
jgi:hypothetical protein